MLFFTKGKSPSFGKMADSSADKVQNDSKYLTASENKGVLKNDGDTSEKDTHDTVKQYVLAFKNDSATQISNFEVLQIQNILIVTSSTSYQGDLDTDLRLTEIATWNWTDMINLVEIV